MSLLQDSFQRCLSFSFFFFFAKPPVVYKHFICLKLRKKEFYNENVEKDKFHLPSNEYEHKTNFAKLRFMLLSELWDWSVVVFQFLISLFDVDRLYVLIDLFEFCLVKRQRNLLTILHTRKDVALVSGRPGFPEFKLHNLYLNLRVLNYNNFWEI